GSAGGDAGHRDRARGLAVHGVAAADRSAADRGDQGAERGDPGGGGALRRRVPAGGGTSGAPRSGYVLCRRAAPVGYRPPDRRARIGLVPERAPGDRFQPGRGREFVILEGKKILVTGVVNRHSIAFSIAERAQAQGAEVLLTSFGRVKRMTERSAARLDPVPDVLELDVNSDDDIAALRDELKQRWGTVDGAVHAIAFAPGDAIGGDFMGTPRETRTAR